MALRRWISPALTDALGSVLPDRFQRFEVGESWEDAERRCMGYEQSTLQNRGSGKASRGERIDRATSRDLQLIAAVGICLEAGQRGSRQPGSPVRVLDFGGAFGHYFDVATSAFPNVSWEWTVVETPTMVALAARTDGDQAISWTADLDSALEERQDFVLASAALNYVPDPMTVLKELGRTAPCALLTRLPLWPVDRHLPAVHRLSRRDAGGAYPTWVFSEAGFLDEVGVIGDVVLRFDIPEDTARIAGHRGTYTGLLVRTKDPS